MDERKRATAKRRKKAKVPIWPPSPTKDKMGLEEKREEIKTAKTKIPAETSKPLLGRAIEPSLKTRNSQKMKAVRRRK